MIEQLSRRTETPFTYNKITVFTDGNDDYTYVLPEYFDIPSINYAQLIKIREKGRVIGKQKRIVYGNADANDIETINVENFNGILRERISRLVRETKCFAKSKHRLTGSVTLFQFYWNFMNEIRRGESPGMLEGLTDHPWTWQEFFHAHLTIAN